MIDQSVIKRILKRTVRVGTCWFVEGWHDGKGYRNISIKGKTYKTHRVMFEWFWRRKLRKNIQLDHKCCQRSCCNPLHLQPVTNKTNSKLRDKRRRNNVTQLTN